ncbi:MAG: hypothetical protein R3C15_15630 [Thermoleophilia bacterium]
MTGPVWDVFEAQLAEEREAQRLARARRAPRTARVVREQRDRLDLVDELMRRLAAGAPDERHARILGALCVEEWQLDESPELYAALIAQHVDDLASRRAAARGSRTGWGCRA